MNTSDSSNILQALKAGGVVVMRTDTVYGLVASALSPDAVNKLYKIKGRDNKPGTIIAANIMQLAYLGLDKLSLNQAEKYWPGPNSIVLPAPQAHSYLHFGLNSLAVRIPDNQPLVDLLLQSGPLVTTSANLPGKPIVENINEAIQILGKGVDLYVDGGIVSNPIPSNVYLLEPDGSFKKIR